MTSEKEHRKELETQKRIAYTAGLLYGDITIRTLFESLAESVIVVDATGRVVLINQRAEQMFGYSKMEIQGEHLSRFIPSKFHEVHDQHLANFFSEPRIRPMGLGLELVGVNKNGQRIPVEISLSFLEVETGKLGLAFITDISKRKQVEEDLKKKNEQLDQFAQAVAHNLNTDINAVVGMSELLINFPESFDQKEQKDLLKEIATSSRKMSDVVREILLFARIKKEELLLEPLDMRPIIDSAVHRLQQVLKSADATLEVNELSTKARGYGPWIEEVWLNFISNAAKYGGRPAHLTVGSDETPGQVRFWIKDNGLGLMEEQKAIVFDENNPTRRQIIKGHGLGLIIVKQIIEKLDGAVGVESVEGKGSTFYFSLPRS